jgi:DNA-binding NtrC family response regulator
VPPLRERRLDIPLLAAHFLERFGEESARRGRPKRVGALLPEAEADLVAREWRGNVRELENVLRLAWIRVPPDASIDREALAGQGPPPREPTPVSLADAEDVAIRKAMERSGGNVAAAARLLGIDRTTLWRKLKKGSGY